ncbi:MAG: diacylglycerol/lipid kinase family protein, partial [Candidatus Angelobacter sp.]
EALNGLMSSSLPAALGVIPMGSGNLLGTDLGLPQNAAAAAQALLRYRPRGILPGVMTSQSRSGPEKRYFIVAAGVGSDAELMYRTAVEAKERWGRNAYFIEMGRMALHGNYPLFQVEWEDQAGKRTIEPASLVMAIRATRFPGLLRLVNLGSSVTRNDYRLLLFRTGKVRHFMQYFTSVATGLNWKVPQVGVVRSNWFRCTALETPTIHAQADGELLGRVPVEVGIGEKAFRLLMAPDAAPSSI